MSTEYMIEKNSNLGSLKQNWWEFERRCWKIISAVGLDSVVTKDETFWDTFVCILCGNF